MLVVGMGSRLVGGGGRGGGLVGWVVFRYFVVVGGKDYG